MVLSLYVSIAAFSLKNLPAFDLISVFDLQAWFPGLQRKRILTYLNPDPVPVSKPSSTEADAAVITSLAKVKVILGMNLREKGSDLNSY